MYQAAPTPANDAYLTPMAAEKLSASLRAGTFDAKARILRTCSLPDLTSLIVPTEPQDEASPAWKAEYQSSSEESGSDEHTQEALTANKSQAAEEVLSYSVYQGQEEEEEEGAEESGEEDMFQEDMTSAAESKEGEGVVESGGGSSGDEEDDEDEWSSSEDEDLRQLVETLQNFVEESSKLLV